MKSNWKWFPKHKKTPQFENHGFLVFLVSQLCKNKIGHCINDGPVDSFAWFYQRNMKNENVKAKTSSQIVGFRALQEIMVLCILVGKIRNAKHGFSRIQCRENEAPASILESAMMHNANFHKNAI